jgi:hypothetical protein
LGYQERDEIFAAGISLCLLIEAKKVRTHATATERISKARKTINLGSSNVL